MFDFNKRELLIIVASLFLASAFTVLGTLYVIEHYFSPHDPSAPLARQGGLKSEKIIKR